MFFSLTQPAFGPIASLNRFRFTPGWHGIAGLRGERTDRAGRERALRLGEDGLSLYRHVLLTRAQRFVRRRRLPE